MMGDLLTPNVKYLELQPAISREAGQAQEAFYFILGRKHQKYNFINVRFSILRLLLSI
jgi:hypothetical protein